MVENNPSRQVHVHQINKKRVSIPASIRTQQDQDWFYGDRLYIFDEVCKAAHIKEYEERLLLV